MAIVAIDDFDDPRVAAYRSVKDRDLHRGHDAFLVEGAGALRELLASRRFAPESLLLSPRALAGLGDALAKLPAATPVYVAERADYHEIVGFDLHRGCLALCRRGPEPGVDTLLASPDVDAAAPLLALEDMTNHDNVGGLFRNARAFGAAAVLLSPRCCDPLYRKAIRTSIGATLALPWARASSWPGDLAGLDAPIVALHPAPDSVPIGDWTPPPGRFVLVAGTEGPGLSDAVLDVADLCLRVEMVPGIDSINVALAAGIALHHVLHHARHPVLHQAPHRVRASRHRSAPGDAADARAGAGSGQESKCDPS